MSQRYSVRSSIAGGVMTLLASAATAQVQQSQRPNYPETKKVDQVDTFFGTKVADPYRWMEDLTSPELAEWVKQENALTEQYLSQIGMRAQFKSRITELWDYPKVSLPFREAGRLFYARNSGLQRQSVFYTRKSLGGVATVVID